MTRKSQVGLFAWGIVLEILGVKIDLFSLYELKYTIQTILKGYEFYRLNEQFPEKRLRKNSRNVSSPPNPIIVYQSLFHRRNVMTNLNRMKYMCIQMIHHRSHNLGKRSIRAFKQLSKNEILFRSSKHSLLYRYSKQKQPRDNYYQFILVKYNNSGNIIADCRCRYFVCIMYTLRIRPSDCTNFVMI